MGKYTKWVWGTGALLMLGAMCAGRKAREAGGETSTSASSSAAAVVAVAEPVVTKRPQFKCEAGEPASGDVVDVRGSHELRSAPSTKASKLLNEKATETFHEKHYHSIDNSTRVQVQCSSGDWARVQITDPSWLTDVVGWVERAALHEPRAPGEKRTFTEEDVVWDKDTRKFKAAIVKGLNRIHREDARCAEVMSPQPMRSPSKSTKAKPVFFVQCGKDLNVVNVFFSPEDVASSKSFSAPVHIDKGKALQLCEGYAKDNAAHRSTVDFYVFGAGVTEHANGRTTVLSSFTAKNSFGLELKFDIRCLLDGTGLLEGHIAESR